MTDGFAFRWEVQEVTRYVRGLDVPECALSSGERLLETLSREDRLDLLWNPIREKLRFVLVQDKTRTFILVCSDLTMNPTEIVEFYAHRFKIEVMFKTLKHLMGGFTYHFWATAWKDAEGRVLPMEQLKQLPDRAQRLITEATNAIEAFVNIALIATGMLQLLAMDYTAEVRHRWWLRTCSSEVPSEEMVKTDIQHEFYHHFHSFKHTAIYRIIRDKERKQAPDPMRLAAIPVRTHECRVTMLIGTSKIRRCHATYTIQPNTNTNILPTVSP